MTEPQEVLLRAAQDVLAEAGNRLRERGWPVELWVDHLPDGDTYQVSLRYVLPTMRVPVEVGRKVMQ